jgi:quercetin dioxygenase-like cupin family protein
MTQRATDVAGCTVVELVAAAATDGRYAVQEFRGARGFSPPLHAHTLEDETLYVLEGEVSVTRPGRVTRGGPGTCVTLRRREAHTWRVESDEARVLVICAPGGLGDVYFETCPRVAPDRPPRAADPAAPGAEALARALASRGVLTVPPPGILATRETDPRGFWRADGAGRPRA